MEARLRSARKLLLLAATFTAVFAAFRFVGRVDELLLIWPASGVALAFLLPGWKAAPSKDKAASLLTVCFGVAASGLAAGMPLRLTCLLALLTCLDLLIACRLMAPHIQCFNDLKLGANMVRFGLAAVLAPMVSAELLAVPISHFLHQPLLQTMEAGFLAASLGLGFVFPPIFFLAHSGKENLRSLLPYARPAALPTLLFAVVTSLVFYQNFGPFLFLVFPPMILLLLTLGLEGAVLASMVVTTAGWLATAYGRGPMWLIHSGSQADRTVALQLFIWVCIATAMPIGALLDQQRRTQKRAGEATSIYQTMLQNTENLIILSTIDGSQRFVSPAIEQLTGWTPEEYLALGRLEAVHPDDHALARLVLDSLAAGKREHTVRYRILRKDGDHRWVEASVRAYGIGQDETIAGYVSTVRDITDLKQVEEAWLKERADLALDRQQMEVLACTDALTGVLNRRGFDEAFRARLLGHEGSTALLLIDVDFFKSYNDSYGHPAGDACLSRLAAVFARRRGRTGDIVARLGGEEFAILLAEASIDGALKVAEEVLEDVRGLGIVHGKGMEGIVTISIGIAGTTAGAASDASLILEQADEALYLSKSRGRNTASRAEAGVSQASSAVQTLLPPPFEPAATPSFPLLPVAAHHPAFTDIGELAAVAGPIGSQA